MKRAECKRVVIPANSEITLHGMFDKPFSYRCTWAMIQSTSSSVIPDDLNISPSVFCYQYDKERKMGIDIYISNVTTRAVSIPTRALLCEIQAVDVEDRPKVRENIGSNTSVLEMLNFEDSCLSSDELKQGKQVISEFVDILSMDELNVGNTTAVRHRIELEDDTPFKQRHRRIPPSMYQEVEDHLQQLLAGDIIRRSHSLWSSNVVLARKKT